MKGASIMFGIRPDGRELKKGVDPITRFTPLVMRQRSDAQVMCTEYIDADKINDYIKKRKKCKGVFSNFF